MSWGPGPPNRKLGLPEPSVHVFKPSNDIVILQGTNVVVLRPADPLDVVALNLVRVDERKDSFERLAVLFEL